MNTFFVKNVDFRFIWRENRENRRNSPSVYRCNRGKFPISFSSKRNAVTSVRKFQTRKPAKYFNDRGILFQLRNNISIDELSVPKEICIASFPKSSNNDKSILH